MIYMILIINVLKWLMMESPPWSLSARFNSAVQWISLAAERVYVNIDPFCTDYSDAVRICVTNSPCKKFIPWFWHFLIKPYESFWCALQSGIFILNKWHTVELQQAMKKYENFNSVFLRIDIFLVRSLLHSRSFSSRPFLQAADFSSRSFLQAADELNLKKFEVCI